MKGCWRTSRAPQHAAEVSDHEYVVVVVETERRRVPAIVQQAELRPRMREGADSLGRPAWRKAVQHPCAFRLAQNEHDAAIV